MRKILYTAFLNCRILRLVVQDSNVVHIQLMENVHNKMKKQLTNQQDYYIV